MATHIVYERQPDGTLVEVSRETVPDLVATDVDKLRDAYVAAMVDLNAIIDGTITTNAQAIAALKKLAAVDKKILTALKHLIG